MIKRLDINSVHTTIDDKLNKYVTKKIGNLDKYIPRHSRTSAHAEIKLKEAKSLKKESQRRGSTCEVILHLPHENISVSETTLNMYAAIDIVEMKLKHQITKYKEMHSSGSLRRRLTARFARGARVSPEIV